MDLSVIIVSYNTKDLIIECIKSIFEKISNLSFEIIVVDNNSDDNSPNAIKSIFPDIKIIENKKNLGFARANNQAIKISKGKYIFLLNPDTVLLNDVSKVFFEFMEKSENASVGCCGGNLYNPDMTKQLSYGNFPTIKHIIFEFGLNKIFKNHFQRNISDGVIDWEDKIKEVDIIIGADMFIRKIVLEKSGLFDEDFFLYYEEAELCYRIKKSGYQIVFLPDAKIMHMYSQSSSKMKIEDRIKTQVTGKYLFFKKSYGNKIAKISCFLYIIKYLLLTIITMKNSYSVMLKCYIKLL